MVYRRFLDFVVGAEEGAEVIRLAVQYRVLVWKSFMPFALRNGLRICLEEEMKILEDAPTGRL